MGHQYGVAGLCNVAMLSISPALKRVFRCRGLYRLSLYAGLALLFGWCGATGGCKRQAGDLDDKPFVFKPPFEANLLFISIDTVRADHLGCHGYDRPTSPRIDELAAESHRFAAAYTVMPTTLPSHASMFTSLYPAQFGVLRNGQVLAAEAYTLAERLKERQFATAAFVGAVVLHPLSGLEQGFDTYISPPDDEWPAGRVRELACEWLRDNSDKRFFCFVHLFDPHTWYEAPAEFAALLEAPARRLPPDRAFVKSPQAFTPKLCRESINAYDAEIRYADHEVGKLLDTLSELGLDERTIVVVVSDHGEAMDELLQHYGFAFGHGKFLYRDQLHIPFVARLPREFGLPGPVVHEEPVSTLDLLPTVLELLDVPCESPFEGRSLVAVLAGRSIADRPIIAERRSMKGVPAIGPELRGEQFSVIDGQWHWICSSSRPDELYDLAADPQERTDVLAGHTQIADNSRSVLDAWLASAGHALWEGGKETTDPELLRGLEALGYVGRSGETAGGTED